MNCLYYGDCLTVMQEWPSQYVDLIYLDPPFNSNRQYNAIYKDATGRPLPNQIEAFCDMWELDAATEQAIRTMPVMMREAGIDDEVAEFWRLWMHALRSTQPRLLAYLSYMTHRLLIMRRILKPTGSLYLHCDPTASHYIKALLDAVFGHKNFRNEIVWCYTGPSNTRRWFPRKHDILLFYANSEHAVFNRDQVRIPYSAETLARRGRIEGDKSYISPSVSERGRRSQKQVQAGFGKGKVPEDWWDDVPPLTNQTERMGYATQKPLALLKRIIEASSNEGDVVLDPFCGCATTLEAAQHLNRQWIGIDIAIHAIKRVAQVRLTERCGLVEGQDFTVDGVPRDLEGAQDLWERDKYHFQKWAVEQVDGFVTTKRTVDGGIDGRLYFDVPGEQQLQSMALEVKGGRTVNIADVRALRGVLDHDDALMAGLIVMHPFGTQKTRNFERFMGEAGTLDIMGIPYPRMQILTVAEILEGKRFHTPTVAGRHEPQPALPGVTAT